MSKGFDLTDLLEKEEAEMIYKRELSDLDWEHICFNLKTRFWSKVRKEMTTALDDAPDYFITQR